MVTILEFHLSNRLDLVNGAPGISMLNYMLDINDTPSCLLYQLGA